MSLKVEKQQVQETWTVTPTPGYVLKFTEVNMKEVYGESEEHRCFLNICHCEQLPPPTDDIDEDELAARIDKGDIGYRIPVSIGELDSVVDSKGRNQPKIDVLVNSVFYEKRLSPAAANFFRHFFCMVICDAIEEKHHLKLDPNKCIKLKNRTVMGSIEPMRIAKRPVAPVIQEIASSDVSADVQPLKFAEMKQPDGVRMRLLKGTRLEIELSLQGDYETSRLRLRMNRDRIVLLEGNTRSLYDFCVPFYMDTKNIQHKISSDHSKLLISVPIVYT
ncbi:unnamed protein product [Cylicocyclus nassatus]|uniref:PIH1 N-terminal domain-containing protein n=1 Tax=Cylicocyclus nassatus TaxID=53992 RepID=A0AA36GIE4_CYLNA|nr:unnamed protein product [Cylicocyclus nassatus]